MTVEFRNDTKQIFTFAGGRKLTIPYTAEACSTPIEKIRRNMARDLATALRVCEEMGAAAVAEARGLISDLREIKQKIEGCAKTLGYSERCRESIATCRGECCRWHFPQNLSGVDFLIAVSGLASDERAALVKQVRSAGNRSYQCPLLRKDGCIFIFENRPVVCTSAFPCLAGTAYWQYKERFRKDIDAIRTTLGGLIDQQRTTNPHYPEGEGTRP